MPNNVMKFAAVIAFFSASTRVSTQSSVHVAIPRYRQANRERPVRKQLSQECGRSHKIRDIRHLLDKNVALSRVQS
jgi:hypothetical protein